FHETLNPIGNASKATLDFTSWRAARGVFLSRLLDRRRTRDRVRVLLVGFFPLDFILLSAKHLASMCALRAGQRLPFDALARLWIVRRFLLVLIEQGGFIEHGARLGRARELSNVGEHDLHVIAFA